MSIFFNSGAIPRREIDLLEKFRIGELNQWALIRGTRSDLPLLLFLHGGPGFAQISFAPAFQAGLEEHFLVVNWDQRGAGKSFSKHVPRESLNLEQYISDTHTLVQILLARFNQKKLFLAGHSWGSTLAAFTVQRYPELFHALIVSGFGIEYERGERLSVKYLLERAAGEDNARARRQLETILFPLDINKFQKYARIKARWMNKFGGMYKTELFSLVKKGLPALWLNYYKLSDRFNWIRGLYFSRYAAKSIIPGINLFQQIPHIPVPVYFCIGRHDYLTPWELTQEYFEFVKAPLKKWIWFEESAHYPFFEEPDKFKDVLVNIVLAEYNNAILPKPQPPVGKKKKERKTVK